MLTHQAFAGHLHMHEIRSDAELLAMGPEDTVTVKWLRIRRWSYGGIAHDAEQHISYICLQDVQLQHWLNIIPRTASNIHQSGRRRR